MTGAVGVITLDNDAALWQITGEHNGLIYCVPLAGPRCTRVILPGQFWVLIDTMP